MTHSSEQHWVVEKRDDAILGNVQGVQSQKTIEGPFDTYDEALEARGKYQRFSSTYYAVVVADTRPPSTKTEYNFVDGAREFEDVPGW